jgi:4-amino-4-deoxy-L-arabinose transferase-like glycosyltransferase
LSATDTVAPEIEGDEERRHARFLWAVTGVTAVGLWVVPSFSSFWLDETLTVWVIRDGLATAVDRSFEYQQSPFYYVVAWAARQLLGTSEFALRVPSLLTATLATYLLFRLAARLHDRETGRLVAFAFVASPWMAHAATDARAYAIAIAATVGAVLALERWLDGGSWWDGLWFVLGCAVAVWCHYVFGVTVAAIAAYAAFRIARTDVRIGWRHLFAATGGILVLVAPLAGHLVSLLRRSDALTIPGLPIEGLLTYILRPAAIGGVLFGVVVAKLVGEVRFRRPRSVPISIGLWSTWALAGPVGFYILAVLTPLVFLLPRYLSASIPAIAALVGLGIVCVGPAGARRIIVAVAAIIVLVSVVGTQKFGEEWRAAATFIRGEVDAGTPVLLRAGLIESAQPDWLTDPERSSYLMAPAAAYDFGTETFPLPYVLNEDAEAYLEGLIDHPLDEVERFLFVTRDRGTGFEAWFGGRLADDGYVATEIGTFGGVYVVEFEREPVS